MGAPIIFESASSSPADTGRNDKTAVSTVAAAAAGGLSSSTHRSILYDDPPTTKTTGTGNSSSDEEETSSSAHQQQQQQQVVFAQHEMAGLGNNSPGGGGTGGGPTKTNKTVRSLRSVASAGSGVSSFFEGREKQNATMATSKSVIYGRLLFLLVLAAAAATLGFVSFQLMSEAEENLAAQRFDSIAARALSTAELVIQGKKKATDSLALMVGNSNPNASAWPNVYMKGFEEVSSSLRIVTEGSLSFCPIVLPGGEEQTSFEAFAYDLFTNVKNFPEGTGESAFGNGVFSYGDGELGNETWPDGRFHITSGWTYHHSPREFLCPFLESDSGAHDVLMLNIHFEHNRAAAMGQVMNCSDVRAATQDWDRECGGITDLMWSETAAAVDPGPAGLIMVPIYPRNEKTKLTGFIVGKQIWHDLLKHGFESDVDGLDVVLRTENHSYTYRIVNGEAIYVGEGTGFIDPNASFQFLGTHINPTHFSDLSVKYYMDVYSNEDFHATYSTTNPRTACIGAVLIIVGTSLLFFFYDYFVRKEFHDKKKLMEAKRQFVRFVSHEVRTPLNTVCMGLSLMQHDFASALGLRKTGSSTADSSSSSNNNNNNVDAEKLEEWMQLSAQVYHSADAAVNVLSDLLNYDKIQMGMLTLELSMVPILTALEKTVNEFKIAAAENKIRLVLDLSPLIVESDNKDIEQSSDKQIVDVRQLRKNTRESKVIADNVRLAQVLRNLLSNGLKFTKENGNLQVRVSFRPLSKNRKPQEEVVELYKEAATVIRRGSIEIEVIDDGLGMAPHEVKAVFNDGTQFNANQFQAGGGSGLGLNIAKGIVVEHGGRLSCSSPGMYRGTTFTLSLPLYDEVKHGGSIGQERTTTSRDATLNSSKETTDADFRVANLYILVVDDALTNRKLCMRLLERTGHTCEGACNGKEAVAMVRNALDAGKPYDCILLDYEMPEMNGPESCERIRKLGCSAYIAGVTGNLMSEDVDHFRHCGANWVFPKPFRLEALEEQWIEDNVTPQTMQEEPSGMVRVESGVHLASLGDAVGTTFAPVST